MPVTNKLTDTALRNAKAETKTRRLFDGGGLYLEVTPQGRRYWRLKYRYADREKRLALGVYPEVSLADARAARSEARRLLAQGIDPAEHRKAERRERVQRAANSFEAVAREWIEANRGQWSAGYAEMVLARLQTNIFPWLGGRPVAEIEAPELLDALRRAEGRGAIDTARRVRMHCGQVFRYAIATSRAARDPAADLKGALTPRRVRHYPTITEPKRVGALLRAIDSFDGTFPVKCALRLAPLLFARPGELRAAEWAEIDLSAAEWRIPAEKMKAGRPHVVPLSPQAVAILRELKPLTDRGRYVFPSNRGRGRPMSENTLNAALRRIGYAKDEMTAHGFRGMASTLLHELGWDSTLIELQLAHMDSNTTRASYNHSQRLAERRAMLDAWADYLDTLRDGSKVTPIRRGQSA